MKIKTLIVDDEPKNIKLLEKYLKPYAYIIEIIGSAVSADDAFVLIKEKKPNLIFLDISMPGSSGLDLLNRFAKRSFEVVFTTAHKEYAIEAFNQSATHYLLKPISLLQLDEAINRCISKLEPVLRKDNSETIHTEKRIIVYSKKDYEIINAKDILRCEAHGSYTDIYLDPNRKIVSSQNLKAFELKLEGANFFRIHKSHLINLNKVKSFTRGQTGYVTLIDNTQIHMSKLKRSEFLEKFDGSFVSDT